jgi:hypothetical protein
MNVINGNMPDIITSVYGKPCCKQRVWRHKSLTLGFGERIFHGNSKLIDNFWGEWEIRTYCNSWRVIKDQKVICGSNDTVDSIEELDAALGQIAFGRILSLTQEASGIDIRARFDTGIIVDFLTTISEDDETVSIFCPGKICVTFSPAEGWLIENRRIE